MKYEAIVIGAGVMGTATAYALLMQGVKSVLLLEQFKIGHDRASSTDWTKAIRYEYAEQELYSHMVGRSIELWRHLGRNTGTDLYVECGVVCWGRGVDSFARRSYLVIREMGIPIRELDSTELRGLFPQFDGSNIAYATYNPQGGFLRASSCVEAFASEVKRLGGEIRENAPVTAIEEGGGGVTVTLENGDRLEAERVAITAGAWEASFLPKLGLRVPLTANKQQVVYIAGLGEDFAPGRFPVFLNLDHDYYGFPLDANGLFKASVHLPGPVIDPDVPQMPDPDFTDDILGFLRDYIPRAARGSVVLNRTCMYDMTPDEDFIIDKLPGSERVVVAGGFSGHGFKFGPVIGRLVASLITGDEPEFTLEPFRVSRFEGIF